MLQWVLGNKNDISSKNLVPTNNSKITSRGGFFLCIFGENQYTLLHYSAVAQWQSVSLLTRGL